MVRALVCFIVFAGACQCQEGASRPVAPAARPEAPPVATEPEPTPEPPVVAPPGPKLEDPRYTLEAKAAAAGYRVGRAGEITLELELADTYTLHSELTISVRIRAPSGMGITRSDFTQTEAEEITPTHARFSIPLRPTQSGEANVDAFVNFVICQGPDKCEPREERVMLSVAVQ